MCIKFVRIAVLAFLLPACAGNDRDIVATVDGKPLTLDDVFSAASAEPYNVSALMKTESGRKRMVEGLIELKILEMEAGRYGIDRDPAVIKRLADIRSKVILTEYMKKMQEGGGIEPKEEDIKKYYDDNISDYLRPKALKLSQILLTDRSKAESVMKAVTSGVSFERMAKEQSEDPASKDKGGSMGFIRRGELIEELENAAFAIEKAGMVTGPVETPFGYHILKLTDRTALEEISFDKARDSIRKRLHKKAFDDYIASAKKNYKIRIYDDVLKQGIPK